MQSRLLEKTGKGGAGICGRMFVQPCWWLCPHHPFQVRDTLLAEKGQSLQVGRDTRKNGYERGCSQGTIGQYCLEETSREWELEGEWININIRF